jgi:hypothetical protein
MSARGRKDDPAGAGDEPDRRDQDQGQRAIECLLSPIQKARGERLRER